MTIRTATDADSEQIAHICLLTGAAGTDASGKFSNDTTLADVYATPYLHGPDCFAFVWDVEGEARGYIVGTTDTRAFQQWFVDEWWPTRASRHPPRTIDDAWLCALSERSAAHAHPAAGRVPRPPAHRPAC